MLIPLSYSLIALLEALVRVCNEIDRSGTGGTPDDYAFIRAILQDVVVDAMFQVCYINNVKFCLLYFL